MYNIEKIEKELYKIGKILDYLYDTNNIEAIKKYTKRESELIQILEDEGIIRPIWKVTGIFSN